MSEIVPITKNCVSGVRNKIVNQNALGSFNKIAFCTNFEPGYLCQIKAVVKEVLDAIQLGEKNLQEGYKKLANKDEKNEPKTIESEENGQKIRRWDFTPEAKIAADKLYEDCMSSTLELSHRPKLYFSKLAPAQLSAVDLINLEWLINEEK